MPRPHLPALLALALVLLSPSTMWAQPGGSKATARAKAREAARLFDEGKYREAIAAFEEAYAIRPHYLVQCNIARCYEILGEPGPSAEHYRRCLKEGAEDSPQAGQVREALAAMEKKVAEQRPVPVVAPPPPPPPPPPPRPLPAVSPRPFWAVIGLGAGIEIRDLPAQLKLRAAAGYHFSRGLTGPSLGLDLTVGVAGGFTSLEIGPLFSLDIALAPRYGLYVAPVVGVGLAHLTTVCYKGRCEARTGLDLQLGVELKLIIVDRLLIVFRPVGIDLVPTNASEWVTSLRYDLLMSAGLVF